MAELSFVTLGERISIDDGRSAISVCHSRKGRQMLKQQVVFTLPNGRSVTTWIGTDPYTGEAIERVIQASWQVSQQEHEHLSELCQWIHDHIENIGTIIQRHLKNTATARNAVAVFTTPTGGG